MKIEEGILKLQMKGIKLWSEKDALKYKAAKGSLDKADIDFMKESKQEIIAYLKALEDKTKLEIKKENLYYPFPQNEIQRAYSIGKTRNFKYGGVCCHTYMEIEYEHLDRNRVELAFNKLIKLHPMLRAKIYTDGTQEILSDIPSIDIKCYEDESFDGENINMVRNELEGKFYKNGEWPQFDIILTHLKECTILHFSMEFLIADWTSMWLLLYQFEEIYFKQVEYAELELTFRDYVIYKEKCKNESSYLKAKEYWKRKVEPFFEPPVLPIIEEDGESVKKYKRLAHSLNYEKWAVVKNKANLMGVTPTALILTIYAYVIQKWSENKEFAVNVTLLNRDNIHSDIMNIIGDFTSVIIHGTSWKSYNTKSFTQVVKDINMELFDDIDHLEYSGVDFLRDIAKNRGANIIYPIAFTSALGITSNSGIDIKGKYVGGLTETPQVLIDCQAMDGEFGFNINWDIRDGVFKQGITEDMFECFLQIIDKLADENEQIAEKIDTYIPQWQYEERIEANHTEKDIDSKMLHEGFLENLRKYPKRIAIVENDRMVTYEELGILVGKVVSALKKENIECGMNVGIFLGKSIEQIASVLGVLFVGGVYVPIDPNQGEDRIAKIIKEAEIQCMIVLDKEEEKKYKTKYIEYVEVMKGEVSKLELCNKPKDGAYIIFTSGSTGVPKGVEVSHFAAMNTIIDVIERFGVSDGEVVFALSKLNFDLSVFDIFGILYVGGKIVLPTGKNYLQPTLWHELIIKHEVTLWNSVPALMEIYLEYINSTSIIAENFLRLIWLSGDWVRGSLIKSIKNNMQNVMLVAMGGATEAAIWSIYHICDEKDIECSVALYGKPLGNQRFNVLDENLEECPVEVPGELYIMGDGLATGYFNDEERTNQKFIMDPSTGIRMYATGDWGKYIAGGEIEFLGRKDSQVKINGFRIELGEIESVLMDSGKLDNAIVLVWEKQIYAFVSGDETESEALDGWVNNSLPQYMVPYRTVFIDEIPLNANGKVDRNKLVEKLKEDKNLLVEKSVAWSAEEEKVRNIFEEIMKCSIENKKKSFYDYGADSLVLSQAVNKILAEIPKEISFDDLLAQVMNSPTIEETVKFIENSV